jgi:hypothetical protein
MAVATRPVTPNGAEPRTLTPDGTVEAEDHLIVLPKRIEWWFIS